MGVYKTLYCVYTTKKIPHESTRSIRIYFEILFKWRCKRVCHKGVLFSTVAILLNWRINVVIIVNSMQLSMNWNRTINYYACGSLIGMCWLDGTHFSILLSGLFSTLRASEMLLVFINYLISIFAITLYK